MRYSFLNETDKFFDMVAESKEGDIYIDCVFPQDKFIYLGYRKSKHFEVTRAYIVKFYSIASNSIEEIGVYNFVNYFVKI
ncbi:MAG: hypothetical protein AABY22_05520 [Nanoarchaeota archaeon]